jgi:hypothetical protein
MDKRISELSRRNSQYPLGVYYSRNLERFCHKGEEEEYFSGLYKQHWDETF